MDMLFAASHTTVLAGVTQVAKDRLAIGLNHASYGSVRDSVHEVDEVHLSPIDIDPLKEVCLQDDLHPT
jgi:hypothetical protein